ncbi:hypothetical protein [Lyngbya aestuarii]|uniref:hypothetical protein n=1 Tax=Lyngbya aestuarii TaxID=118322 RepID=UPI00403DD74C
MNIKHPPLPLSLSVTLGSFLLLFGTSLPAQAQLSDITGAIITTSDIVDGFPPSVDQRTILVFTNDNIAIAVNQAANSVNAQLAARNFPVVVPNRPIGSISPTVQQALESVLTETSNVEASTGRLVGGLARGCVGVDTVQVRDLVSSLQGLTTGGEVDAASLDAAVEAYNQLINDSNQECLANPPEELLAIQSLLVALLNGALTAAR